MTRQEQRKLREIIAENRAYYRRQLQGTEPCRWDCCVLTASTTRQARGYELEIAYRQRAGWLPPEPRYLVVPDLGGRRIGSAGAACYALRRVMQHWAEQGTSLWEEARILLINSGGDSKRIPHCSVFGKVFANLPFELFHGGPQSTVFDELMVAVCRLPESSGTVILSGDVLLVFDPVQFAPPPGVTGLACATPWPQATQHGVYICSAEGGSVGGFLQKPTHDEMRRAGALHEGQAFIDTGLLAFDSQATQRLAELAGARWQGNAPQFEPGVLEQPGTEAAQIDLYGEVCPVLAGQPPPDGEALPAAHRQVRERVVAALAGLEFHVAVAQPAVFVHLGTTRDWHEFCTQRPAHSVHIQGSVIGTLWAKGPAILEYCRLPWCQVGEGALLSGVEQEDGVALPEELVLHQVPLVAKSGRNEPWVVQLYAVEDNPKAPLASRRATFCGQDLEQWLDQRGLTPAVVWPHVEPGDRCLWTARLFVPGDKETSLRWALWLAGLPEEQEVVRTDGYCVPAWREQERISLAESLQQADQEAIHQHRARLRGLQLGQEITRQIPTDDYPHPLFDTIGSSAEIAEVARSLTAYLEAESDPLRQARAYKVFSDLMADARLQRVLAETDGSPGELPQAIGELLDSFSPRRFQTPSEASQWLADLAFQQVGTAVAAGLTEHPREEGWELIVGTQVSVSAPARIDFGGGWSDTPPFSLEHGGAVLNAAILLDGQRPIVIRGEVLAEPVIEVVSVDGGAQETIIDAGSLSQYQQPGDPLALHKAAITLAGLAGAEGDLAGQLQQIGGGLYLETNINLPHGSGLGTSSIAALALLRCLDLLQGRPASVENLSARVLYLEQMLTTGGGWQDQLGGGVPGMKLLETEPGPAQHPRITHVQLSPAMADQLSQRLLVCFVGEKRVAKNILRQIMGRYLSRVPAVVKVLHEIKDIARAMKAALEGDDLDEFGRLMARHWELNKALDEHSTTAHVEQLFAAMGDLIVGAKMAGAGGGGFMEIIAKDGAAASRIRQRLQPLLAAQGGRFYEVAFDWTGVVYEVQPRRRDRAIAA